MQGWNVQEYRFLSSWVPTHLSFSTSLNVICLSCTTSRKIYLRNTWNEIILFYASHNVNAKVRKMNPYPKTSKSKSIKRTYLARSSANSASNLSLHTIKVSIVTGSPCGMTIWKMKGGTKVRSSSEKKIWRQTYLKQTPNAKVWKQNKNPVMQHWHNQQPWSILITKEKMLHAEMKNITSFIDYAVVYKLHLNG